MRAIKKYIHWMVLSLILIVFAIHGYILHGVLHFDWSTALQDAACSSLILSLSIWSVVLVIRAYPTSAGIFLYALFMALVAAMATTTTEYEILKRWLGTPDSDYQAWLKHSLPIRFVVVWIFNSWMATNAALRKNIVALDSRFQQQSDASILLKEAELFKLRQQLQPIAYCCCMRVARQLSDCLPGLRVRQFAGYQHLLPCYRRKARQYLEPCSQ